MSEMTCREFDQVVHGFVRMELLDMNLREAALEHAPETGLSIKEEARRLLRAQRDRSL